MIPQPVIHGEGRLGVAIVAPSGYAPYPESVERAIERFVQAGYRVVDFTDHQRRFQRFGDTDEARLAQLHAAASHPDVSLVIALRGGYGLSRIVADIDFALLAKSGKLFVGYSDFTLIHLGLLKQGGASSLAGPMICDEFGREALCDRTIADFWHCANGPEHEIAGVDAHAQTFAAEGILWGGNLAMLVHAIGSAWMPEIERGILFLEDIAEHPFRVERMLLQLHHAGVLEHQRAIVLGDFSGYKLSDMDNGYDFDAMLQFIRAKISVPIVTGLRFGHIPDKDTLAVGARARLQCQDGHWTLRMSEYRQLKKRESD